MEHGRGGASSAAWLAAFHLGVCSISPLGEVVYWLSICKVLSGSFWMQDSRSRNIFHCLFCQNRINMCNISSLSRTGWNSSKWPHHMAVPTEGPGWIVVVSRVWWLPLPSFQFNGCFYTHVYMYACLMCAYISIWFKTYSSESWRVIERERFPSHPIPICQFLPHPFSSPWLFDLFLMSASRVSLCTYKQIWVRIFVLFLLYTKGNLLYLLFCTLCSSLSVQRKHSYSFYHLHSIPVF